MFLEIARCIVYALGLITGLFVVMAFVVATVGLAKMALDAVRERERKIWNS